MTVGRITFSPWGVEQTKDTNWIGPMRESGDGKVADVVCSIDRLGLTRNALKRNDARARLIAAAPELLAALKLAQLWLANCVPTVALGGPKPLPVIAVAIAKATGEKP